MIAPIRPMRVRLLKIYMTIFTLPGLSLVKSLTYVYDDKQPCVILYSIDITLSGLTHNCYLNGLF